MERATVVETPATWLPEDDILLKNSIEEGASLEALAKGAVPFSHAFTLQEVHDRWHALLYDPEISAQACNHLLLDESEKAKEIIARHRKRKVGSLRKRYHDRVKRIRNEFFGSVDIELFNEPSHHRCNGNGGDFNEQGTLHDDPQVGNAMLGGCMPTPFGLQVTDLDVHHQNFPQALTGLATNDVVVNARDGFHCEGPDHPVNNRISDTTENGCLHGFPVSDSPFPVHGSLGIVEKPPFQPSECNEIPNSLPGNSTEMWKGLPGVELSDNGNSTELWKGFPGGELSSTGTYTMGFSPSMPWKTIEGEANMPVNVIPDDRMQEIQDVSELPDPGDNKRNRADKQNGDNFTNSASMSDGEFVDLPDSLFDFPNDDMLFLDEDDKVPVDKACDNTLSGVLMGTGGIDNLEAGKQAKVDGDAVMGTVSEASASHLHTLLGEEKPVSHVQVQLSSAPMLKNKLLEHSQGVLFCALNTEDPDIPCNDDIFLLIHPDATNDSSAMTSTSKSAMDLISSKERNNVQILNSVKKREELVQSSKQSLMFGSFLLPEMGQVHTGGGPRAELKDTYKDLAPRQKATTEPNRCKTAQKSLTSAAQGNRNTVLKKVGSASVETPAILRESPRHTHTEAGGVDVTLLEPEIDDSASDEEGPESDNEDLQFSDIEAMILDMDLCSYDDDLHFTRKVAKYQQGDSKKTIIRLEQCARASIQRAMTSQGALALLYGRHSRHFICKKEVILGRATAESVVDIDLGKEGRNSKISRRQAIVKMEDDGSFSLKNLAKSPILVNGAEVRTGELITLSPSCLVEIRGLSFVFESNQKYVDRYLQSIGRNKQGQMAGVKYSTKQERG